MPRVSTYTKFSAVRDELRAEILDSFTPGEMLPAETEIAERFEVNRHTVRRALQGLVDEGLIARQAGQGSWVLGPPIQYEISPGTRFSESMMANGCVPSCEVISGTVVKTPAHVSNRFEVRKGVRLVQLELLRSGDGTELVYCHHWLPAARFPKLEERYRGGSLHQFIEAQYGISIERKQTVVSAELAGEQTAKILHTSPRHPVLITQSVNIDKSTGLPIEYVTSAFKGSAVQLILESL